MSGYYFYFATDYTDFRRSNYSKNGRIPNLKLGLILDVANDLINI